jgi:hypothetical protein
MALLDARSRQDRGQRGGRGARGGGLPALLRSSCAKASPTTTHTRRSGRWCASARGTFRWRSSPARSRRAGRRQYRAGQAGRADAAGRGAGGARAVGGRRAAHALQLLPGRGEVVGKRLVADARVRGVLFTGSTEVARLLQRGLAGRAGERGRAIPLIAETGGQNAMIVDSSALAEQVVADVLASAFDSAGQRCSALRVLCVQHEAAERAAGHAAGRDGRTARRRPGRAAHRRRPGDRRRARAARSSSTSRRCAPRATACTRPARPLHRVRRRWPAAASCCPP